MIADNICGRVADVVTLRWIYKKSREHARRMKYYRGEVVLAHPKFPAGSLAATQSSASPVEISAPNIIYSKEDDDAIDKFHREIGELLCIISWITVKHLPSRDGMAFGRFTIIQHCHQLVDRSTVRHLCYETSKSRWCGRWTAKRLRHNKSQSRR